MHRRASAGNPGHRLLAGLPEDVARQPTAAPRPKRWSSSSSADGCPRVQFPATKSNLHNCQLVSSFSCFSVLVMDPWELQVHLQNFEEDLGTSPENLEASSDDDPAAKIPFPSPEVPPKPAEVEDKEEDNVKEQISEVILSESEPILVDFSDVTPEELPKRDNSEN